MFRKRKKIIFPEGTFIPTRARVLSIIQLCLGFAALLFAASEPFMGEHFTIKSKILLYDFVLGKNHDDQSKLFSELSEEKQQEIILNYENLKNSLSTPFIVKLQESLNVLIFKKSSYERAWILFALIIPILLLKKVEGARHAAWIFPLIVASMILNNELVLKEPISSEEAKLFPKEEFLVNRYIKKDINLLSIADQQKELLKSWHHYLIEYYVGEAPSEYSGEFQKQITKGEFGFNLARIEKLLLVSNDTPKYKQPLFLLMIYFFWNLLFALGVSTTPLEIQTRKIEGHSI